MTRSTIRFALAASAIALSLAAASAPAQASILLFAGFNTGADNRSDFRFVNGGPSDPDSATMFTVAHAADTTPGAAAVKFSFMGDPAVAGFVNLDALFTYHGAVTDTPAGFSGATYTQTGIGGDFQFAYNGATQTIDGFTLHNGDILFSGVFTNAWIQGSGGVGGLDVSLSNGGVATFSSAYLDLSRFSPGTEEYSLHIGNVTPHFGRSGGAGAALDSFTGHLGGEFQAAIPEPATWALMITGFGAAGAVIRRRRRLAI